MTERMRLILESKRAMRQHLATRPFSEKIAVLEKLPPSLKLRRTRRRGRSLAIAASSVRQKAEAEGFVNGQG
jgi:hypothetical protein